MTSMTTISPIQERAVHLLLSGSTVAAAARELGIDRTTIYSWRKNHPHFATACQQARKLHTDFLADNLQDLALTALDTLREILVAKDAPPAVRLRAAQAALSAANQRPFTPPQVQNDSTDFDTFPPSPAAPAVDEAETPASAAFRHATAKIGRNEPCPCGSRQKYKRCCGGIGPRIQTVNTGSGT